MAKITDYVKFEVDFPDSEYVKADTLINKEMSLLAVKRKVGENGDFYTILANVNGKKVSFSCGATAIKEKIKSALKIMKLPDDEGVAIEFKETIDATFVSKKSASGRYYFDFI